MKDKIQRTLGLFPLTNIVVANMIGAGIFTTSGLLMAGLHNPVLMIGLWLLGGVIALLELCFWFWPLWNGLLNREWPLQLY